MHGSAPATDGKVNGVQKQYYANGVLQHEANFTDNKQNGFDRVYYENGNLKREAVLVKNKWKGWTGAKSTMLIVYPKAVDNSDIMG